MSKIVVIQIGLSCVLHKITAATSTIVILWRSQLLLVRFIRIHSFLKIKCYSALLRRVSLWRIINNWLLHKLQYFQNKVKQQRIISQISSPRKCNCKIRFEIITKRETFQIKRTNDFFEKWYWEKDLKEKILD